MPQYFVTLRLAFLLPDHISIRAAWLCIYEGPCFLDLVYIVNSELVWTWI